MNIDWLREYCLSYPGATEEVQWENHLLFKVGGKIFVLSSLDSFAENVLSIKSDPNKFDELIEIEGIIPAPYLARNKWISIQRTCRIKTSELKDLITTSYDLVFSKLPKNTKLSIQAN